MVNKNYPHPVLNAQTDDFIEEKSNFDIQVVKKIKDGNIHLNFAAELTEPNLEKLIAQNRIAFAVSISCPTTKYTEVFEFYELNHPVVINFNKVRDKINLNTYIVAKDDIDDYTSPLFNEDYDGAKFKIFTGDILAEGSQYDLELSKQIDPLTKIASIFQITVKDDEDGVAYDYDYDTKKINIILNKSNFNIYRELKEVQSQYNYLPPLMSSLVITPVLIDILADTLLELKNCDDDSERLECIAGHEKNQWFKVLNLKMKNLGYNLEEGFISDKPPLIVQKLLGEPLSKGLLFFEEGVFEK